MRKGSAFYTIKRDNGKRVRLLEGRDVPRKKKSTSIEVNFTDEDLNQEPIQDLPERARDGQPKKQKKTGGMETNKYSKTNPHPLHIEDPKHYTYLGRPRCQYTSHTTKQCHRTATIDGEYCSGHYDISKKTAKGTGEFPRAKDLIVKYCREGYTIAAAAARVDVNPATVSLWRRLGKEAIAEGRVDEYSIFIEDLEQARLYACSSIEKALFTAAVQGNVSACIRYLECRMPDVWNAKRVVEMSGQVQQDMNIKVAHDLSSESDISLRSLVKQIASSVEIAVGEQMDNASLEDINGL